MYLSCILLYSLMTATSVLSKCTDEKFSPNNFYPYMSTKTSYGVVNGKIQRSNTNCELVKSWTILRHGSRYTSKREIVKFSVLPGFRDKIIQNHKEGRGCMDPEKFEHLKNWTPDIHLQIPYANKLTTTGREESFQLGQRMRAAFPELVIQNPQHLTDSDYFSRVTNNERTNETLRAFAEGFFGKKDVLQPTISAETEEMLTPHYNCHAWKTGYEAEHIFDERNKFIGMPSFQTFLHDISIRLGFTEPLTWDDVYLIYMMCRYEFAWYPTKYSAWCMLFHKEEMMLFEYAEDLSYYADIGPGRTLSKELGCFELRDMFKHFKEAETGQPQHQPKGVLYVGHTASVQLLLSTLQFAEEQRPLKAENYRTESNRMYRTSTQAPFQANLVALFFRCNGNKKSNKIMFYLNEKPITFKYCKGPVCDWEDMKRRFQTNVDKCTIAICDTNTDA